MSAAANPDGTFSAADIEAGRRLFVGDWNFLSAANSSASLPKMAAPEIAFAGRSNVGKSSLINALVGRRALARVSRTPGRTQELIFFAGPGTGASRLVLVDMPGYGYAAAAKIQIAAWTGLIHEYLVGRATLMRVYLLVDSRHGLMTADEDILAVLDQAAVSYQIVLTKSDHAVPAELTARTQAVETLLRQHPAAYPTVLATSAATGTGVPELRAAIARLLQQRSSI